MRENGDTPSASGGNQTPGNRGDGKEHGGKVVAQNAGSAGANVKTHSSMGTFNVPYPYANISNLSISVSWGDLEAVPYTSLFIDQQVTIASANIVAVNPSSFIQEKNAFEQSPLIRLYTLYYPGEWFPPTETGNPGGDGQGYAWPVGFPFRFAEIRGDYISDIRYSVLHDNVEYMPYPINSEGIQLDSSGKINEVSINMSNFDNLITQLVENPFLVGNNTSNATAAIVNGELVQNIDPRTIPGHTLYNPDIAAQRGGINLAFDYESTQDMKGNWQRLKQDSRDLLGGVIEIKSTFAKFLDVWPEYSVVKGKTSNLVEMINILPYRIGDNIKTNVNSVETTITNIDGNFIVLANAGYDISMGQRVYIVNPEADPDNFVIDEFKISSLESLDEKVARFQLSSWLQYFKYVLPKRRFLKNTCPWVYKGPECQYSETGTGHIFNSNKMANGFFNINNEPVSNVNEDVCAKNDRACALRNNEERFGGFTGSGTSLPR